MPGNLPVAAEAAPAQEDDKAMRQATGMISIATQGCGFTDITARIARWLEAEQAREGLLTLFIRHTSASLIIQENADPVVLEDLAAFLSRLAPWGEGLYAHDTEGPDDMPAHIRAALTQSHLAVPVTGGALALGTWQALYLAEHRAKPHVRQIALHLLTE